MATRSVTQASFTVARTYDAAPARVFAAFADPATKARWFAPPDGWHVQARSFDFRVGGRETNRVVSQTGEVHAFGCLYQDIVPDERILYSYAMDLGSTRISVSLAIIEFRREGAGTRLSIAEHGAFLDGYTDTAAREHGTAWLLEQLGAVLQQTA